MPEPNELDEVLYPVAVRADALRAGALKGLHSISQARQASLERERDRLSRKLGPGHPHVRAMVARIEHSATRLAGIKVEVARAEAVAPRPGVAEWILHGYVWFKNLDPAPDLTVSLVDERVRWIQELGFACTDSRGYFRIVAPVGKVEAERGPVLAGTIAQGVENEVRIRITDRDRRQVYMGSDAIAISPGSSVYREIVLGEVPTSCGPPEEAAEPKPEPKPPGKKRGSGDKRR